MLGSALLANHVGNGFCTKIQVLDKGGLHTAALCVVGSARDRKQFDQPIACFQLVLAIASIGDREAAYILNDAFAEQGIAAFGEFYAEPDENPLDHAAFVYGAFLIAYFVLVERGSFKRGETVLVVGAWGAVALAATQIARALGAARVFGAAGRQGTDVVRDPLGGASLSAALIATVWSERLVVIGFAAADIPSLTVDHLLLENTGLLELELSLHPRLVPERLKEAQDELFNLRPQGLPQLPIAHWFSLDAFPGALDIVPGGRTGGRASIAIERTQA